MDLLDEVIDGLNAVNASTRNSYMTDVELSEWMGRSPRYVSMLRATGKPLSLSSVTKLGCRLKRFHADLAGSNLRRQDAERIYSVVKLVFNEMNSMALGEKR